jgi:hypothetical protein
VPLIKDSIVNVKHMKTKLNKEKTAELRSEYDLAALLKEGVKGKYAKRYEEGGSPV